MNNQLYYNSDNTKDAFYRLKVSLAATIADIKHIYDKNPNQINEKIIGTGVSNYRSESYIEMKVFNQNDSVIRQTKEYYIYQSGKSKSCIFTGVLNMLLNTSGFVSRIGCFDSHLDKTVDFGGNGVFFELSENILYVVLRYGTINQTDIKIPQSQFSHDKLDGRGTSKFKLDRFNHTMIFQIDFQWLGGGIVRYFIHINGIPILLHVMENRFKDVPYMKSGDLPIRYEITKTGNNANVGEMRQICSAIQIESGYNLLGFQKFEPILAQTAINVHDTTLLPIFSIRLKSNCNRSFIKHWTADTIKVL